MWGEMADLEILTEGAFANVHGFSGLIRVHRGFHSARQTAFATFAHLILAIRGSRRLHDWRQSPTRREWAARARGGASAPPQRNLAEATCFRPSEATLHGTGILRRQLDAPACRMPQKVVCPWRTSQAAFQKSPISGAFPASDPLKFRPQVKDAGASAKRTPGRVRINHALFLFAAANVPQPLLPQAQHLAQDHRTAEALLRHHLQRLLPCEPYAPA